MLDRLLRSASGGDREAMAEAFELYRDRLAGMVALRLDRRTRKRLDIQDVLQEVYIEASRRLSEFLRDRKVPFFLWLRFLTGQKVIEMNRHHLAKKRDAGREVALQQGSFPEGSTLTMADRLVDSSTRPSSRAIKAETRVLVQAALEQLEPLDREILLLRHFERLTNVEAAQVLGIKEGAASQRHFRALKRLRELLEGIPGLDGVLGRG
jgi:RNA polymerase sigma-70 factor (ECF subfamily)